LRGWAGPAGSWSSRRGVEGAGPGTASRRGRVSSSSHPPHDLRTRNEHSTQAGKGCLLPTRRRWRAACRVLALVTGKGRAACKAGKGWLSSRGQQHAVQQCSSVLRSSHGTDWRSSTRARIMAVRLVQTLSSVGNTWQLRARRWPCSSAGVGTDSAPGGVGVDRHRGGAPLRPAVEVILRHSKLVLHSKPGVIPISGRPTQQDFRCNRTRG
jgi:hypothetical protein